MIDADLEIIKTAIDREIAAVCEAELEAAKERIDKRKDEIIAGIVLNVSKMVEIERAAHSLVIKIIKQ